MKRTIIIGLATVAAAIGAGTLVTDAAHHPDLGTSSQQGGFGGPGGGPPGMNGGPPGFPGGGPPQR